MARISPLMIAPPAIFAGLVTLFLVGMLRDNPDNLPSALEGRSAPAVQVAPLGGGTPFTDTDLRHGGVKLVNYWASWCAPCRAEHPSLEKLAESGIAIYGVNYKDNARNALDFLDELGNPYAAIGADGNGRMALDWGVYGVPETYVIDADGQIVLRFAGPVTNRILETTILPAIKTAQ